MRSSIRIICAGALLAANSALASGQNWYLESPASAPPARRFHAMAFDQARAVTVLFGGVDERAQVVFGDTWEYDGAEWTLRSTTGPGPRERFASCFDSARGRLLVFGGADANGGLLADTWAWDGSGWARIATRNAPSARIGAQMSFDEARGRVVLFGGRPRDPSAPLGDTWEFDGADWTARTPTASPDPRHGHAMTYDPRRGVTVLFGGFANGAFATNVDTWEFDGTTWHRAMTANVPPASIFPGLTFHRGHGVAVLTGSTGSFSQRVRTFAFDGIDWHTGPSAPAGFSGRQAHATAYDAARDAIVLFGGAYVTLAGANALADTWELSTRAATEPFGAGCASSAGTLSLAPRGDSRPTIGRDLVLDAGPVPAGSITSLLLGFSDASHGGIALPLDLTAQGLPGCELLVGIDAIVLMGAGSSGVASTLSIPLRADLVGRVLFAQALTLQPGALPLGATSNALRATLGN